MASEIKEKEEIVYKADPFTFVFRELDLIHNRVDKIEAEIKDLRREITDFRAEVGREIKNSRAEVGSEIKGFRAEVDREIKDFRAEVNGRMDKLDSRMDKLYIIVIANLIGIAAFLIKTFFFAS